MIIPSSEAQLQVLWAKEIRQRLYLQQRISIPQLDLLSVHFSVYHLWMEPAWVMAAATECHWLTFIPVLIPYWSVSWNSYSNSVSEKPPLMLLFCSLKGMQGSHLLLRHLCTAQWGSCLFHKPDPDHYPKALMWHCTNPVAGREFRMKVMA